MLDIGFTSLETEDSVLIILSKSNVRSGDFQVYKGGLFEVGRGIRNLSKSQKSRPSYLECGINVEIVVGNRKFRRYTFEYLLSDWESIFFNFWKETSSAL